MKKFTLTLAYLLITVLFINAQTYTLTDADVVVTNGIIDSCYYDFEIKDIIIPDTLNGQAVIGIGDYLINNKGITSAQLPSTLQVIGEGAFQSNSLISVIIPNSVTSIGERAFQENNITNVIISNSVTSIPYLSFAWNRLTSVTIPNSVTSISYGAFYDNSLTSLTIPNSVTSIGEMAFQFNDLKSVIIPNSVTSIGSGAFTANNLTSVTIPSSIDSIPSLTFSCNKLTSVTIPNSVTIIKEGAFKFNQLTSVTLSNSVTSINADAFYDNKLISITIPNSVTSIGSWAFLNNNLISVTIPNSVTSIGSMSFNNNQISEYNNTTSNGIIYARNKDGSEDYSTIVSYGGIADTIDFIPDSVTTIAKSAFAWCNLTSVTIPNTVDSIANHAFWNNQLNNVMFEPNSNIQFIDFKAFFDNALLTSITLPVHANPNAMYKGRNGIYYNEGDKITDFIPWYKMVIKTNTVKFDIPAIDLVIYPNPSKGKINLKVTGMPINSIVDVIVLNINGIRIFQNHFRYSEELSIDMSKQSGGLYFVKIISGNNEIVKKLVLDKN